MQVKFSCVFFWNPSMEHRRPTVGYNFKNKFINFQFQQNKNLDQNLCDCTLFLWLVMHSVATM